MKQYIIDWQPNSILAAVCSGRGAAMHIDKISWQAVDPDDAASQNLSSAIQAVVSELAIPAKAKVTVVSSRENVEVRTINVPHMDADDLPDVIRFQSQRQLASMTESWTLDYVMLPHAAGQETQTALVAAMSPERLKEIESACEAASLTLEHIAFRPIEIARHAQMVHALPANQPGMVVCLSPGQIDSMLANNGQLVQIRSTRLPSDAETQGKAISGDIRRSLLAAANLVGNRPISQSVVICGASATEIARKAVVEATDSSVEVIEASQLLPNDATAACEHTNRLAGILGATHLQATDSKQFLDFKNPKRRPAKQSRVGQYVLAAVASVLVLAAGFTWWTQKNNALDSELEALNESIESKEPVVAASDKKVTELALVKQFLNAAPNFLDELKYVADKMPPSDETMLSGMQFSILNDGSGHIQTIVRADKAENIADFEESIRDENHVVAGRVNRLTDATDGYKWAATENITISGRGWNPFDEPQAASTEVDKVVETELPSPETNPAEDPAANAESSNEEAGSENAKEEKPAEEQPAVSPKASDDEHEEENAGETETPTDNASKITQK